MGNGAPQRLSPIVRFIATGAFLGYAPVAPGTVGAAGCAVVLWFLAPAIGPGTAPLVVFVHVLSVLALVAVSVWASGEAERTFGKDASRIVIDEWAGFVIAIFFLPKTLLVYAVAFVVFRAIDILKPYPARRAESLPGGWGIVMDDVIAGIYTNLLVRLMLLVQGG
jgi:phosphatidylglycerophosphatase A